MTLFSRKKINDLLIYGIGQAVNVFSPLLVIPFIVEHCGEANLGRIGVAFSFSLIAIVVVDGGSYINGTREIAISKDNIENLGKKVVVIYRSRIILLAFTLILATLLLVCIPFLRRDFVQILFSLLIVVGQAINPTWFFQGIQNFKWVSFLNILSKAIYISGVFWLVRRPHDYVLVNALWGAGLVISSSIGLIYIFKKFGFRWSDGNFSDAFTLIRSESSLTVSQLFFSFYQYLPIIIIGFFGGDILAGKYRIIDQVVMVFRTYLQMFFNFIYPEVCTVIFNNDGRGFKIWKKYNVLNYVFVMILLGIFFSQAEWILSYFKVASPDILQMSRYFRLALLIPVVMGVTFALKQLVFAFNENKKYIRITVISTILTVGVMSVSVSVTGLIGAFVTIIAIETIVAASYIFILRNRPKKTAPILYAANR